MKKNIGYVQTFIDDPSNGGMYYPVYEGGDYQEPVLYPTDLIMQDPIATDTNPIDTTTTTTTTTITPTDTAIATDTNPVYIDQGGESVVYTPIDDSTYIPEDMLSTTDQLATSQDFAAENAPTTTGNKLTDWIKANPLLAGGIAFGLYLLFNKKVAR